MKPEKWPFTPEHITNDGEDLRGEFVKLSGVGIISNDYLQGLQTGISAAINNPTTVFEFSPDGDPVRSDARFARMDFRFHCRLFRECTDRAWCKASDDLHARMLWRVSYDEFESVVAARLEKEENAIGVARVLGAVNRVVPRTGGIRPYVEYDCPWLGYREVAFPIVFEERVIAAFFVGEILLADHANVAEAIREGFLQSPRFVTSEAHASEHVPQTGFSPQLLAELIRQAHGSEWGKPESMFSESQYADLIKKTDHELDRLEKLLAEEMGKQRRTRVHEVVDQQVKAFLKGLPESSKKETDDLRFFWKNLERCLVHLQRALAREYVLVFGIESPFQAKPLGVVARAGAVPPEIEHRLEGLSCTVPRGVARENLSSQNNEAVLGFIKSFDDVFDRSKTLVRVFAVPFTPGASFAVVVGFGPHCTLGAVENKKDGDIDRAIRGFYDPVASALSSVLASMARDHESTVLRVLGHELNQVSAALDGERYLYLELIREARHLTEDELDYLNDDIAAHIRHYKTAFVNARFAVGNEPVVMPDEFYFFGELLVKCAKTYEARTRGRSMRIQIPTISADDPERPKVYADPILLEQVLINLLGNALKYSYMGTNIYVDCRVGDAKDPKSPHVLSVVNYGLWLESKDDIWELYGRGRNALGQEGLGIGLYCVRRIVEAHNGNATMAARQISAYNVPLIEHYIDRSFPGRREGRVKDLIEERERLKRAGFCSKVIARDPERRAPLYKPSDSELADQIKSSTWEIRFEVTIPRRLDHE